MSNMTVNQRAQFERVDLKVPTTGVRVRHRGAVIAYTVVTALLVGALIIAQLVVALFGSSRRRRRDLALLSTLGFRRRQVAGTVAWQAVTLVGLALLLGVPLGIAAGRAVWTALIDGLGAVPEPIVPAGRLAALSAAVAALTAHGLAAEVTQIAVSRTRPAGRLHLLMANNPIFLITGERK